MAIVTSKSRPGSIVAEAYRLKELAERGEKKRHRVLERMAKKAITPKGRPGPDVGLCDDAVLFKKIAASADKAKVEKPAKAPAKSSVPQLAHPKENASQSGTYMARVRKLACRRCGFKPKTGGNQFAHADQGKGQSIKTDVREGSSLCGPRGKQEPGCHWLLGTSGKIPKAERRRLEKEYAASTRAELEATGQWPKNLAKWEPKP